jgi:hypothetical protein
MFEALNDVQRRDVYRNGSWIVAPMADFERIDPKFVVPMEPIWVWVPPQHLGRLSLAAASLRNPSQPMVVEFTESQKRAKRLRTTGKFHLVFVLELIDILIVFSRSKCSQPRQ